MAKTGYINKDGARILHAAWAERSKDQDYRFVRSYDNGTVRLVVEWVGEVKDIDASYADMWKVFRLNVYNYNADGKMVVDPVEHGKWYPTLKAVNDAYDEFIVRWTESRRTEDGKLVELDNDLLPPPPPNPDAPDSDVTSIKIDLDDGGVGAW